MKNNSLKIISIKNKILEIALRHTDNDVIKAGNLTKELTNVLTEYGLLKFYYFDKGMLTAFILAQAMTEEWDQGKRDEYFDMMIEKQIKNISELENQS